MQRLHKQVPTAANKQATIEVLLSYNDGNGVFVGSTLGYITRIPGQFSDNWGSLLRRQTKMIRTDGNELVELQECGCEKKTSCVLQLQWDCHNYYVEIRYQDTTREDRILVCV
jgi:hypothetical protein